MKKIKKSFAFVLLISFMIVSSYRMNNVEAKTFGELKKELEEEQKALKENKENQTLTEEQIAKINQEIKKVSDSIDQTYRDIDNLTIEIEALNKNIEEKEAQIKEIINFSQISDGDSAYLEYIFNANDFTDFIYRSAVAEQLADYNDKLIDEFNQNIEDNKKKQKEIEEKRISLNKQQQELEKKHSELGTKLEEFGDEKLDIEKQISYLKDAISVYEDRNCKDDEDIDTCGDKLLPKNTQFYRPLEKGYVTSEYNRTSGHWGIDVSVSPNTNVKVYSAGTGVVSNIGHFDCGGNFVVIWHQMTNGQKYSTFYMHLKSVSVKLNQDVTKDTVIGIMGGNATNPNSPSNYTPNDTCTFGAHNHFGIANCWYLGDSTCKTWRSFMLHTVNPRSIVNFPSGRYNWFTNRLTKY